MIIASKQQVRSKLAAGTQHAESLQQARNNKTSGIWPWVFFTYMVREALQSKKRGNLEIGPNRGWGSQNRKSLKFQLGKDQNNIVYTFSSCAKDLHQKYPL